MRRFRKTIILKTKDKEWQQIKKGASDKRDALANVIASSFFILLGLSLIVISFLFMLGINPLNFSGNGWAGVGAGSLFAGGGAFYLILNRIARRLIPEWQLYERLNTDYATLNRVIRDNDVQPRFIINGDRYYAPTDFGEIATLLRASSAPATAKEVLLRPAADTIETPQEQLLRAAETIVQEMPAQADLAMKYRQQQAEEQPNRLG